MSSSSSQSCSSAFCSPSSSSSSSSSSLDTDTLRLGAGSGESERESESSRGSFSSGVDMGQGEVWSQNWSSEGWSSEPWGADTGSWAGTLSGTGTGSGVSVRRRQIITDQAQVQQALQDCQFNSGNNVISCFPTADTVVPQHQYATFVWNSRRPEITQTNLVDIFLFRADSQAQILHLANQTNPPERAGFVRAKVDDKWFGADGFNFSGQNVSFPFYWVIIRSDATLANGNFVPQPIFSAVQTTVLDAVAAPTASASSASSNSVQPTGLSGSGSGSGSLTPSSATASGPVSPTGNVQHASSASSFPRWAIAVIVVLGFFALAASCILVFVILRRLRRRQQRSSASSSRGSMGSASPMMPREQGGGGGGAGGGQHGPDMMQRYDSAGSPLLAPAALGAGAGLGIGAGLASVSHRQSGGGAGSTTHDGASAISDTGGPFSGADAAIMADAFRKMLRKPDFAGRPMEEGESPEHELGDEGAGMDVGADDKDEGEQVLRGQLAEEGRDIRSVSSSRGVKVESVNTATGTGEHEFR